MEVQHYWFSKKKCFAVQLEVNQVLYWAKKVRSPPMPFIRSFFNWTFLELLLKSSGSQNLQVANRPSNVLTKIDLDHPCFFYPKTKLSIFIVTRQIFSPIFFWAAVKEQILEWQVLLNLSLKVAGLEPVTSWLWANLFVVLASGLCPLTAFVKNLHKHWMGTISLLFTN